MVERVVCMEAEPEVRMEAVVGMAGSTEAEAVAAS
jgi:hypothetical protein